MVETPLTKMLERQRALLGERYVDVASRLGLTKSSVYDLFHGRAAGGFLRSPDRWDWLARQMYVPTYEIAMNVILSTEPCRHVLTADSIRHACLVRYPVGRDRLCVMASLAHRYLVGCGLLVESCGWSDDGRAYEIRVGGNVLMLALNGAARMGDEVARLDTWLVLVEQVLKKQQER